MTKQLSLLGVLVLFLSSCHINQHRVTINDITFAVELADDDNKRALGLMYRKEMADDDGMLFIFPDSQMRAFWMKNTLIPLDILYFDANKKIVSISENTPPCKNTSSRCPNYPSLKPTKYVLEINAGLSEKYGFKAGDEMIINLK
ncbi:DUF192 domain-containing protein [Marinicella litoralis]|uniref:DUF192 domain-containing protein n=1 Tax=Marinicella litoralis TaxID=644220 RepID=A0A4R6Y0B9_9GAMM|nr:DUF192 domain-containing protein [Marinicella litoralis]TDR23553.1 hypothetical protein C8D91_0416 [Marinicella litoralis]